MDVQKKNAAEKFFFFSFCSNFHLISFRDQTIKTLFHLYYIAVESSLTSPVKV